MVEALILISTKVGFMEDVFEKVQKMERVKKSAMITGPYDIMALTEAESLGKITNALINEIRKLEGVKDTTTCVVI